MPGQKLCLGTFHGIFSLNAFTNSRTQKYHSQCTLMALFEKHHLLMTTKKQKHHLWMLSKVSNKNVGG